MIEIEVGNKKVRFNTNKPYDRQGDIYFVELDPSDIPDGLLELDLGECVLGLGETSGHLHSVDNAVWLCTEDVDKAVLDKFALTGDQGDDGSLAGSFFFKVNCDTEVRHTADHDPIPVRGGGVYFVWRQRVFDPYSRMNMFVRD